MPGSQYGGNNLNEGRSLIAATSGVGIAIPFHNCKQISWDIKPSAVPLTGTIVVESHTDPTATVGWWLLDTIDAAALGSSGVSGSTQGSGTTPPLGGSWVRMNITTPIVGGNVTGYLNGLTAD